MGLARRLLLRASRSEWLAEQFRRRRFARRAIRRFMPGEHPRDALAAAESFTRDRIGSVLTCLGERVISRDAAAAVRDHYIGVLEQIRARGLSCHLSVKPTHLGVDADRDACLSDLLTIARQARDVGSFVWIDMEESQYTDVTLELFRRARGELPNVGVCLQAYLRRTAGDLESLLPLSPAIRLVKGAYNEPPTIAYPRKDDTDESFFTLGSRLLEAAARESARPVFGTHDLRLLQRLRGRAEQVRASKGGYEIHMLYGIQSVVQRALASQGFTVRALISYGSAWFPWYMRRLAERPANLWFVVRSVFGGR